MKSLFRLAGSTTGLLDKTADKATLKKEDRFRNDTYDYYTTEIKKEFLFYIANGYILKYIAVQKTAEKVLKETVLPYIEEGLQNGLFEKFFFIRYKDEFPHFRIRFYNRRYRRTIKCSKNIYDLPGAFSWPTAPCKR